MRLVALLRRPTRAERASTSEARPDHEQGEHRDQPQRGRRRRGPVGDGSGPGDDGEQHERADRDPRAAYTEGAGDQREHRDGGDDAADQHRLVGVPNVSIANSLSGRGAASTARFPTASSGLVTPGRSAATASPREHGRGAGEKSG